MPKKISFDNYLKRRGLKAHNVKTVLTTPTAVIASEYFKILNLGLDNSHAGYIEYLKRVQELKEMQEK
jgi:hypothetical protein